MLNTLLSGIPVEFAAANSTLQRRPLQSKWAVTEFGCKLVGTKKIVPSS